jgi:hypothetical protein
VEAVIDELEHRPQLHTQRCCAVPYLVLL